MLLLNRSVLLSLNVRSRCRNAVERIVALAVAMCLLAGHCFPVRAQSAEGVLSSLPGNLNLASTRKTAEAPESLTSPVVIVNGGRERAVTPGMALTPAQALALAQVIVSGQQSIVLGTRGNAVGGSANLSAVQNLSSLTVPKGVSVIHDFGVAPPLAVTGNLVNSGAIYAVSTSTAVTNAIMTANNIRNISGGLITSILPSGGLPGTAGSIAHLDLSIVATNSIFNAGTISSARNLNLVAGNRIVNASPPAAGQSMLSSLGAVNMATQNLVNSGVVQAGTNINIAQQVSRNAELAALSMQLGQAKGALNILADVHHLLVDNRGGLLDASGGSILFDHANATKDSALSVVGGNLLSQAVTADAGAGKLNLTVDSLAGLMNVSAGCANVGSLSSANFGSINILGDPTFYSLGSLNFAGINYAGEAIAIFAQNDIDLGSSTVRSRDAGGQGFNITIVAGAELQVSPAGAPSPVGPGQTVKVVGPSSSGGSIRCTNCVVDSSSFVSSKKAGDVLLAAYHGPDAPAFGGEIFLGGQILADGGTGGQAGNVKVIAPNQISLNVVSMHGTIGAPALTVTNAQPLGALSANSTGAVKGSLTPGALTGRGNIKLSGPVFAPGGKVTMRADRGGVTMFPSSFINASGLAPGSKGGDVTLSSAGNVDLAGFIAVDGAVGADGRPGAPGGLAGTGGGKGGNAGTVTVDSTHIIWDNALNPIDIFASGGAGGSAGYGTDGLQPRWNGGTGGAGGAGGAGGRVTLTANNIQLNVANPEAIWVNGGAGGAGGRGGEGASFGGSAGAGGKGGSGGSGGTAGTIAIKSLYLNLKTNTVALGGIGGPNGKGGSGAAAGAGGKGGNGGKITITGVGRANLLVDAQSIYAAGGAGGDALQSGGNGGYGQERGGNGGSGGAGGKGGKGGTISLSSFNGDIVTSSQIVVSGGRGGNGGQAGNGQSSDLMGGSGGRGGAGGAGGAAGKTSMKTGGDGVISIKNGFVVSSGGGQGGAGGSGGYGGYSTGTNGNGGTGGNGGKGGNGGSITLNATGITVDVRPAAPFGAGGVGGNGGPAGTGPGAAGLAGESGNTGDDGKDGAVRLIETDASPGIDDNAPAWRRSKRSAPRHRLAIRLPHDSIEAGMSRSASGGVETNLYKPVGFVRPMLMLTENGLPVNVLLASDQKEITADAGVASVRIDRGAVAFIVNNGRDVSVLSLHERATGDVTVTVCGQHVALRAGEQLVITSSSNLPFADLNPLAAVACRNITEHSLAGGQRVFISQFSIASALENLSTLKQLASSTASRDRALYDKIRKNAAILHLLTARKGPYKKWYKATATSSAI